jgi:PAP2 superfamily
MTTSNSSFNVGCAEREFVGDLLLVPIALLMATALATYYRSGFVNVDLGWQLIWITVAIWLISRAIPIFSFQVAVSALLQLTLIAFSTMVMTYSAATVGRPLIDRELLLVDQYIGYEWRAYAGFVANHPLIARAMKFSYAFIFFMPLVVIVALSATKNVRALEKFILAGLISLLLTVGVFALFPATTAWTHLQLSDAEVAAFHHLPLSSQDWIGKLIQIRQGGAATLQTLNGNGLIAFPSFHCTAALLFVWSTWTIRWFRAPMVIISLALLVATPIFGGHYISDLIAGAVVMVISIRVTERLYVLMLDFKNAARAFWRSHDFSFTSDP